jgi:hypothetical protein
LFPYDQAKFFSDSRSSVDCLNVNAISHSNSYQHCNNTKSINKSVLWHLRLRHVSNKVFKELCNQNSAIQFQDFAHCDICHLARQNRLPYSSSTSKPSRFFELIHVDIWGPLSISSFEGFKYFLCGVDDHSRYTWIHLLKSKMDVKTILPSFETTIENQFDTKLKIIR